MVICLVLVDLGGSSWCRCFYWVIVLFMLLCLMVVEVVKVSVFGLLGLVFRVRCICFVGVLVRVLFWVVVSVLV